MNKEIVVNVATQLSPKYSPGQNVMYHSRLRAKEPSMATVVRVLPVERDGFTYRIKSVINGTERVATEHELTGLSDDAFQA